MPTNRGAIFIVIGTLAGMAGLCVCAVCVLSYYGIEIPPELNTLTGGLVGALTGVLAKTTPSEAPKTQTPTGEPQS